MRAVLFLNKPPYRSSLYRLIVTMHAHCTDDVGPGASTPLTGGSRMLPGKSWGGSENQPTGIRIGTIRTYKYSVHLYYLASLIVWTPLGELT